MDNLKFISLRRLTLEIPPNNPICKNVMRIGSKHQTKHCWDYWHGAVRILKIRVSNQVIKFSELQRGTVHLCNINRLRFVPTREEIS